MKKEVKVVMLPTEKESKIFICLVKDKEWINTTIGGEPQHLYFVSDEEIKDGDNYCYYYKDNPELCGVGMADKETVRIMGIDTTYKGTHFKIVATTDKSLRELESYDSSEEDSEVYRSIPQTPESFIEEFVKANGKINKVMVEMEEYPTDTYPEQFDW